MNETQIIMILVVIFSIVLGVFLERYKIIKLIGKNLNPGYSQTITQN